MANEEAVVVDNAPAGAVRIRRDEKSDARILSAGDVRIEFKQSDGTWLLCPFVVSARLDIPNAHALPTLTLGVLVNDIGLEFADPEQVTLVQALVSRIEPGTCL